MRLPPLLTRLLLSLSLLVPLSLQADLASNTIEPKEFSLTYELTAGVLTLGEMQRTLSFDETTQRYVYDSYSKPTGYAKLFTSNNLKERSEWIIHNNRLRPLIYTYDRTKSAFTKERHIKMRFDWEKSRVITSVNDDPWSLNIPEGTIDKLLYHLAVVYDLKNDQAILEYDVADGGKMRQYRFERLGHETLTTELGQFDTIKLKLPGKRDTFIWCAPALDYLPVKLEQSEKRGTLLMRIKSAQINGQTYTVKTP